MRQAGIIAAAGRYALAQQCVAARGGPRERGAARRRTREAHRAHGGARRRPTWCSSSCRNPSPRPLPRTSRRTAFAPTARRGSAGARISTSRARTSILRSPASTGSSRSAADGDRSASFALRRSGRGAGLAIRDPRVQLPKMETEAVDLQLTGMTCAACAARIEKVLNRVDGVRAEVNFATESAHVVFDGEQGDAADADRSRAQGRLRRRAGRRSVHATGRGRDRRGRALPARASGVRRSPRSSRRRSSRRWPSMAMGRHAIELPIWLQFALADADPVLGGRAVLRRRMEGVARRCRQHGRADRARHDRRVCLQRRGLARAAAGPARLFRGGCRRDHARAARQAARTARARPHRPRDPRSPALAAGDGAVRARRRNARGAAGLGARRRRLRRARRRQRRGGRARALPANRR